MELLIKNAKVFDRFSSHHNTETDLLIADGVITEIAKGLNTNGQTLDLKGKWVAPGLVDMFAHFNEPGFEHKEDILSGKATALFAGFTDVCLIPNTNPVIQSKGELTFIKSHSGREVDLHPIAAVSESLLGENLTEILDLRRAGAIAFSDGLHPIWNSELLLKALQYVQGFQGLIITRPKDIHLSQFSHMHEGEVSTSLGLKGEPSLSEEIAIKRDLDILRYTGGKLHFTHLSTARGVELIREAKKEGLEVTCDVAIHQLIYTEDDLTEFDSNFKVDPPFRTEQDRKALIKGIKGDIIDAIVTSHQPQDTENKDLEFDLAENGICSMPTVISNLVSLSKEIPLELSLSKLTHGPRKILGLDEVKLESGYPAKMAFLDFEEKWRFDQQINPSKSVNTPNFGHEMTGRSIGTLNGTFLNT